MTDQHQALKQFMLDNFDFKTLKKSGFYSKEIKPTNYEEQAKRICQRLNLKSIYDYQLIHHNPALFANEGKPAIGHTFADNILKAIGFN